MMEKQTSESPPFARGDVVCVTDFPFGKCLKSIGIVVGVLPKDFYNVKITHGFQSGMILKYKYWKLRLVEESDHEK